MIPMTVLRQAAATTAARYRARPRPLGRDEEQQVERGQLMTAIRTVFCPFEISKRDRVGVR